MQIAICIYFFYLLTIAKTEICYRHALILYHFNNVSTVIAYIIFYFHLFSPSRDSSFILDIAYSVRDGRVYEGRGEFTNTLFDVLYTIEYGGY